MLYCLLCYRLQTTKLNTTQSLCPLPGLLRGDSFPITHPVMKDVAFTFSLLCMQTFKIQIKEIFIKKTTPPQHNLLDPPLHEE